MKGFQTIQICCFNGLTRCFCINLGVTTTNAPLKSFRHIARCILTVPGWALHFYFWLRANYLNRAGVLLEKFSGSPQPRTNTPRIPTAQLAQRGEHASDSIFENEKGCTFMQPFLKPTSRAKPCDHRVRSYFTVW